MKYKLLRAFLKGRHMEQDYELANCVLAIDGQTFFAKLYKESGCNYILGGEYDRYAHFLKFKLKPFIASNVLCYFIFNGAMEADIDKRKDIHETWIQKTTEFKLGGEEHYFEPLFVKDVQKQVLTELEIPYYTCEYDHIDAMLTVARNYHCPLVTSKFEYAFYGVPCIQPKTIIFDNDTKSISCKIWYPQDCRRTTSMKFELRPIFMALVNEDSKQFSALPSLVDIRHNRIILYTYRWVKQQEPAKALYIISTFLEEEADKKAFLVSHEYHERLMKFSKRSLAVGFFQGSRLSLRSHKNDPDAFAKAVGRGKIALPYINLFNNGAIYGSSLLEDKHQDDAMLIAADIISYAYALMKDVQNVSITYIGRKLNECQIWQIDNNFEMKKKSDKLISTPYELMDSQFFFSFLNTILPGLKSEVLYSVPADSWMLMVTLVYFYKKRETPIEFAYSVILCYIMLSRVSEKVGLIRRSNFIVTHCDAADEESVSRSGFSLHDCAQAANAFMDMFYISNLDKVFDRKLLQTLSEFQYCLQHMNYLNVLCGEFFESTAFHKTLNVTFVVNVYKRLIRKSRKDYVEKCLGQSPVLDHYRQFQTVFNDCLQDVLICSSL